MKELFWVSKLRIFATLGVIFIHVSSVFVNPYDSENFAQWCVGNIYDSFFRFAVPLFFMISGVLLLNKDYNYSIFIKKRYKRIIPPYLMWSFVYILYMILQKYRAGENLTSTYLLNFTVEKLMNGSYFHLWFVKTILGLYLVLPIVRKWIKYASQKELLFYLGLWAITMLKVYPIETKLQIPVDLYYVNGYLGYIVLGYFLNRYSLLWLKSKWSQFALVLVGFSVTFLGTTYSTITNKVFISNFHSYLSLNVLVCSIGWFLLFKNGVSTNFKNSRLSNVLSNSSYGVYLVHILVIVLLSKIGINVKMFTPIVSIPIVAFSCFAMSTVIIYSLNKVFKSSLICG